MSEVFGLSTEQWQAISAVATAILVLVTAAYVVFTYQMVRAIRDTSAKSHQLAEAQLAVEFVLDRSTEDAPLVNISCVGASVILLLVMVTSVRRKERLDPDVLVLKPLTGEYPVELRPSYPVALLASSWPTIDQDTLVIATISYAFFEGGTQHDASLTLHAWPTS